MLDDMMDMKIKNHFDIILSINTIHFSKNYDIIFNKMLSLSDLIIITEPRIHPSRWGDDTLNEDSKNFNKDSWAIKKNILEKEHEYIMKLPDNRDNIRVTYNDNYRIYSIFINKH